MTNSHTFATNNHLAQEVRVTASAPLNQHLADMIDLYSQIKQAHWNVKGTRFYQPHDLFARLVDEVRNHVDLTAERATALGGRPWTRYECQPPPPGSLSIRWAL